MESLKPIWTFAETHSGLTHHLQGSGRPLKKNHRPDARFVMNRISLNIFLKNIAKEIMDVNQANSEISNSSSNVSHNAERLVKLTDQLKEMVVKFKV